MVDVKQVRKQISQRQQAISAAAKTVKPLTRMEITQTGALQKKILRQQEQIPLTQAELRQIIPQPLRRRIFRQEGKIPTFQAVLRQIGSPVQEKIFRGLRKKAREEISLEGIKLGEFRDKLEIFIVKTQPKQALPEYKNPILQQLGIEQVRKVAKEKADVISILKRIEGKQAKRDEATSDVKIKSIDRTLDRLGRKLEREQLQSHLAQEELKLLNDSPNIFLKKKFSGRLHFEARKELAGLKFEQRQDQARERARQAGVSEQAVILKVSPGDIPSALTIRDATGIEETSRALTVINIAGGQEVKPERKTQYIQINPDGSKERVNITNSEAIKRIKGNDVRFETTKGEFLTFQEVNFPDLDTSQLFLITSEKFEGFVPAKVILPDAPVTGFFPPTPKVPEFPMVSDVLAKPTFLGSVIEQVKITAPSLLGIPQVKAPGIDIAFGQLIPTITEEAKPKIETILQFGQILTPSGLTQAVLFPTEAEAQRGFVSETAADTFQEFVRRIKDEPESVRRNLLTGALLTTGIGFLGPTVGGLVSAGILGAVAPGIIAGLKDPTQRPGTLSELFEFGVGGGFAARAPKGGPGLFPKLRFRTLEIPGVKGKVNLLGFETRGGRSVIVASKTKDGIRVGGPKDLITNLRDITPGKDLKIGSALETKAIQSALSKTTTKITVRGQTLIPIMQKIIRKTKDTESKFIDVFPSKTERLGPKALEDFLAITRENEGVIFGSFSRQAQLAKEFKIGEDTFRLSKIPRDVESRFDTKTDAEVQAITLQLLQKWKNRNLKVRIRPDDPASIDILTKEGWRKAAEFKSKDTSKIVDGEEVPEFVVGFDKTGKPILIEGTKTTSLAEELRGVSQGVARLRKDKEGILDIFPPPKRTKDVASVSVAARTLEQSESKIGLKEDIKAFEDLFPEGLVKQQVVKLPIGDFKPTPTPTPTITDIISQVTPVTGVSTIFTPSIVPVPSQIPTPSALSLSVSGSILSVSVSPSVVPSFSVTPSIIPSVIPSVTPSVVPSPSIISVPSQPSFIPSPVTPPSILSITPSVTPSVVPSPTPPPSVTPGPPSLSPFVPPTTDTIPTIPERPKLLKKRIEKKPKIELVEGWIPEGKTEKTKKWLKLSKRPMSKKEAKDRMAFAMDQSLSAQGRIIKSKQLVKKKKLVRAKHKGYYERTMDKYRNFRIVKGQRVPLDNHWIEKRNRRLDTKKEVQRITLFKLISQQGFLKPKNNPSPKRRTNNIMRTPKVKRKRIKKINFMK